MNNLHDIQGLRVIRDKDVLVHELKVHNGVEKEASDDGFNPAEFQKSSVDERPVVIVEETKSPSPKTRTETPALSETSSPAPEEDKSLADDEFLQELRSMS